MVLIFASAQARRQEYTAVPTGYASARVPKPTRTLAPRVPWRGRPPRSHNQ
jgi:hypothetical protein